MKIHIEKAYIIMIYAFWCQNETGMRIWIVCICNGNAFYADCFQRDTGFLSDYFILIIGISFVLLLMNYISRDFRITSNSETRVARQIRKGRYLLLCKQK